MTKFIKKTIPSPVGKRSRWTLEVDVILHKIGEQTPYFSVTGSFYPNGGSVNSQNASCGCLHETILEHFPNLADVIALHLSDIDGTPMYAYENGKYFLDHPEEYDDDVIAKHFRIPVDDVPLLRERYNYYNNGDTLPKSKKRPCDRKRYLENFIVKQVGRWLGEAEAAITKYNLTPTTR